MKDECIEDLKWYRDEYIGSKQFAAEFDYDSLARKSLCTILIEFLEEGKNVEIVEKYKETFFKLINRAKSAKNFPDI